jgi:LEA14-like dessication related protein
VLLASIAVGIYGWYSYKKPKLSFADKMELIAFNDTSCRVNVSVRIQNENFFSLKAKDITAELGNGTKAFLENGTVTIPGNSDSVHVLAVNIRYPGLDHVIQQLGTPPAASEKKLALLKIQIGFIPYYFDVESPIVDTVKQDPKKLVSDFFRNNISIVTVSKPGAFSMDSARLNIDVKIKNPLPLPVTVKNYKLVVRNPSDSTSTLAELESTTELLMQPNSEQILSNSLLIDPGASLFESLKGFVLNEEYRLHFTALIVIQNHAFPLAHAFSYKL